MNGLGADPRVLDRIKTAALFAVALTVAALIVVPLMFGVLGGFKDNYQLGVNPIGLPSPWVVSNYIDVLTSPSFWRPLFNSIMIALATTAILLLVASMAAFVFARFDFRGRELLFGAFLIGLMFPFAVALLPLFITIRTVGLLNNPLGVILPQVAFGLPVTIIILRGFFRAVPGEVEEAATLDGCTPFGFYWRILMPMSRPILAVVAVLTLVGSWQNFLLPLVVLTTDVSWWTIPIAVTQYQSQYAAETGLILAYITTAMVPAVVFYFFAERQLISGLTSGAVQG